MPRLFLRKMWKKLWSITINIRMLIRLSIWEQYQICIESLLKLLERSMTQMRLWYMLHFILMMLEWMMKKKGLLFIIFLLKKMGKGFVYLVCILMTRVKSLLLVTVKWLSISYMTARRRKMLCFTGWGRNVMLRHRIRRFVYVIWKCLAESKCRRMVLTGTQFWKRDTRSFRSRPTMRKKMKFLTI